MQIKSEAFKTILILSLFTLIGIAFRLYIASFYPHEPLGDEYLYIDFVHSMTSNFWSGHVCPTCSKPYGYPIFLYFLLMIARGNLLSITFVQSILDSLTAVFIFLSSHSIFRNRKYAYVSYFIYLFNPVTASFTGMILSEVLTLFVISIVLFLFVNRKIPHRAFLLGLMLFYLAFVRILLFYWVIFFFILYAGYQLFKLRLRQVVLFLIGAFIACLYPFISNWNIYHQISLTPAAPSHLGSFLFSLKIENWPQFPTNSDVLNLEKEYVPSEGETDDDFYQRKLKPDFDIFIQNIIKNPMPFLLSRIRINLYLWNKSNMYYYVEHLNQYEHTLISIGNVLLLLGSIVGLVRVWMLKTKSIGEKKLLFFIFTLIVYTTATLSFKSAEERLTFPIYPSLILFFPIGLRLFIHLFPRLTSFLSKSYKQKSTKPS